MRRMRLRLLAACLSQVERCVARRVCKCVWVGGWVGEREREGGWRGTSRAKYRDMNDAPKMLRCEACQQVVWLPLGSLTQGSATAATGARNTHTQTHRKQPHTTHTHTHTHCNSCNSCSTCERARIHPRSCGRLYTTNHAIFFLRENVYSYYTSLLCDASASKRSK